MDLRFFAYQHLPERLQKVSKPVAELANEMNHSLPDGEEKDVGLRKLLEAKDAFVRAALMALTLALCAGPARAQETIYEHIPHMRLAQLAALQAELPQRPATVAPTPAPPVPSAVDANEDPFSVSVTAGGLVTLGGDSPTEITPTAYIEADGPLVVGELALGRVGARVGLSTSPGETLDLADVRTWRAADVALSVERVVGRKRSDREGELYQDICTSAVFEWGFASRQDKGGEQPQTRLVRHYGAGVRFRERVSGASLTALYGRDEEAGERGWGQWMLFSDLPIPATKGTIILAADVTLSAGPASTLAQRDIFRFGVVVDVGAVVNAVSR
jgi:hypothetical protein